MTEAQEIPQTNACLICGEPWTRERPTDATVIFVGEGPKDSHTWLCHLDCLQTATHPQFAHFFSAKPS